MQIQIKNLESVLLDLEHQEQESESLQIEKVLENLRKFMQGKSEMNEREQNDILHEFIDKIVYSKNGKNAEVEIEVYLKEEIQDILRGN